MTTLLARIDAYCDAIPRRSALAVDVGSLVVFLRKREGWPFYARPRLGSAESRVEDVVEARRLQREAGAPESFEWIDDVSPAMRAAAVRGGLTVSDHPLMVYRAGCELPDVAPAGVDVRLATPDDYDVATLSALATVGFSHPGTAVGGAGATEVEAAVASRSSADDELARERLRDGELVHAVASLDGRPVGTGVHQPLEGVTEIAGVTTLPSARRRGIGRAVTALLVQDALRRGAETIFLSAGSDEIARVYASLGFERVGTACIAEPAA